VRTYARHIACITLAVLFVAVPRASAQQSVDQTTGLAGLCKVWGLLKYHHPDVAVRSNWDEALVAAIPRFRVATTRQSFNQEVVNLIGAAGLAYVFRELSVGIPREAASLGTAFRWIDDSAVFEPATQTLLKAVVLAFRPGPNNYVGPAAGAGNPDFSKDVGYNTLSTSLPAEAIRLLALFRYWNMVQYYFPCNDVMDRDWSAVLSDLIPVFRRASTDVEYHLAVAQLTASINDTHASTSSSVLSSYWGLNSAPLQLRLVEGRSVVTRVYTRLLTPGVDLRVGDVVTHIDGALVETRRATTATWVNGSNEASLERNIHNYLVRTNAASMTLTVDRGGQAPLVFVVDCHPFSVLNPVVAEYEAQNSVLWTILPGNVGYVNMGLLPRADVPFVMAQLRFTRGIIFDIRNYPQGTLYDVSNYLNPEARPFVKFLEPDFDHPGSFAWTPVFVTGPGSPNAWYTLPAPSFTYVGRVVLLLNQETQSQAEYTAMALRTAPGAIVIGSQTAGADGNVSLISLPGGLSTYFSGLGVFYPDGRPTQRVGIVPDIDVKPSVRGLRDGRDEVLEAAIQFLR
jgi:carboxyl-terminal processing protease